MAATSPLAASALADVSGPWTRGAEGAADAPPTGPGADRLPTRTPRWAELAEPVRALGPQWLRAQEQPHAELLALVWGPRLDREHARQLLAQTATAAVSEDALEQAACCFDALPPQRQQRLRRWLLRQHRQWDNASTTLH